jgi:hypothetical protein
MRQTERNSSSSCKHVGEQQRAEDTTGTADPLTGCLRCPTLGSRRGARSRWSRDVGLSSTCQNSRRTTGQSPPSCRSRVAGIAGDAGDAAIFKPGSDLSLGTVAFCHFFPVCLYLFSRHMAV